MRFGILGPLEIHDGLRVVDVSAPKQRALLILLLIEAGRVVSPDVILDRLWPDRPPSAGLKTVRFHVSKLRSALEPEAKGGGFTTVETQGTGYTINADRHEIDSRLFERLAKDGRRELKQRPDRAYRLLSDALGLWRGKALLDVAYEEFASDEARRLDSMHVSAVEDRIEAELQLGRSSDLVAELQSIVVEYPLRERPAELLMQALYAAGRSAEAISAGQEFRTRLGDIGLDPPPSLSVLEEQILSHDSGLAPTAPHEPTAPVPAHLPRRLSSFIGRRTEMEDIKALTPRARLVSLVGPPGSGKTRLAIEVATEIGIDSVAEPLWVELTDVTDPELVPQAMITAIGVRPPRGTDAMQLLLANLREQSGILVLDNCEHVLGEAARVVVAILEACPAISILATSREVLGVPGEQVWPVPPFSLPPDVPVPLAELVEIDSVQLFTDRAKEANPGFDVDDVNKNDIAAICRRLDGLPLAIELAASATEALSADQILARLTRRFGDVPGVPRQGFARQATMKEAIRWSFDLLEAADQTIFCRLSAFSGGFTMAAAEEVAGWGDIERGDVFDAILRLVHKSLLVPMHRRGRRVRYRMLTVLRGFGQQMLHDAGEHHEVDRRHAVYYADLAESIAPHFEAPTPLLGRDVADAELDNLRTAIDSSITSSDTATASRIVAALTWYWYWRSYISEGYRWGTRLLATIGDAAATPEIAQVWYSVGLFETIMGRYAKGSDAFEKSRAMARDLDMEALEAATLTGMGVNARDQGRLSASLDYLEAAETITRRLGAAPRLALTLRFVGLVNYMLGHRAKAEAALDECYQLFSEIGHKGGMGWALEGKARLGFRFDETPRYDLAERAAEMYSEVHDRRNQAWLLIRTAGAKRREGKLIDAKADVDEALGIFTELGDNRGTAYAMTHCGLLALRGDDPVQAGRELREGLALFDEIGDAGGVSASHGYLAVLAVLEGDPDAARTHAATWLDLPAEDRYVWSVADTLDALADALDSGGVHGTTINELAVTYRAALESEDPDTSTRVDLAVVPEVLSAALSEHDRETKIDN